MSLTTEITITAARRTDTGKGVARQMRLRGEVPAVIYGRGRDPEPLSVSLVEFEKKMHAARGASIIDLAIDGAPTKAVVREIQRHPFRPGILHIDFYEIHEGVKLTVSVPIHLEGTPEGVHNQGGVLDHILREVTIEVLPRNIPDHISVDVSDLTIGQSLHVSDLPADELTILADPSATVCAVVAPRVEEAPAPTEELEELIGEAGGEPELIRKPKEEEGGESAAEG